MSFNTKVVGIGDLLIGIMTYYWCGKDLNLFNKKLKEIIWMLVSSRVLPRCG